MQVGNVYFAIRTKEYKAVKLLLLKWSWYSAKRSHESCHLPQHEIKEHHTLQKFFYQKG